ncbi:MAG: glycerophosphodiester phosphodiesterase family protein [Sphingobium sp.]|jgi:glycerophosphoryl diester phosphodiesterase|nr:glycerophosphodiester phosphodiesterase [Sphingobium sp.]MCP5400646.1 glycerophosphodiester phosphodiesterase [Sphingomonas sp.]
MLPPAPAPDRVRFLMHRRFAHRGLHSGQAPLENSMAAFRAAIAAGDGIECDVRLSADGVVYIFHDADMERLTGVSGAFTEQVSGRLGQLDLVGGNGPVPRLAALLEAAGPDTPVLIELKIDRGQPVAPLCAAVAQLLVEHHEAHAAVMSFHPGVSRWFAKHAPDIVRGLVMTENGDGAISSNIMRHLAMRHAKPDFLAYDIRDLPSRFATKARKQGFPVLSWTVRTPEQWQTVARYVDAPIYEVPGTGGDV